MNWLSPRASTALLSCAALLVLAGCGGSGGSDNDSSPTPPPDPLAVYKNQTVNWNNCDQFFAANGGYADYRRTLGDRVQCANIKAPLDYQNPDGLQISVAVLRVKAEVASEQKPNLLFNPGGPGGDGQMEAVDFSMLLAQGNKDTALGAKYKEVSDAYNFVGFSPRGVGASTNIVCAGNELTYETDSTQWGDTAENIRRLKDHARYTATNCQKNPVSDYIHTDATARDMDLMRHLLGDEKLHYYGVSYGTWLGFWYAGIFPDRVGPMVLDSNMNFSASIHDASISYVNGQIHTFNNYIAPFMARHDNIFHMGTSAGSITADLKSVGHEVNQALHDVGGSFRAEREGLPEYISAIKASIETQRLLDQGKTLEQIQEALTQGRHIDDDQINSIFHHQAASLITRIQARSEPAFYTDASTFALNNEDSVWDTVVCNDEPVPNKDPAYWVDQAFALARSLPIANNKVAGQPCLYWNENTRVSKPSMDSLKDAPLLMVQSEFDVPTPLAGATQTFEMLSGASMVRVDNEGAHGLMVYQTECVDFAVMDYLLGKAPQHRLTECQGRPLPYDSQPLMAQARSAARVSAPPASNFVDSELAEQLISRLRRAVER